MPRATSVVTAAHRHDRPIADTVILDYEQRSAQKVAVTGAKGTATQPMIRAKAQPARSRRFGAVARW